MVIYYLGFIAGTFYRLVDVCEWPPPPRQERYIPLHPLSLPLPLSSAMRNILYLFYTNSIHLPS